MSAARWLVSILPSLFFRCVYGGLMVLLPRIVNISPETVRHDAPVHDCSTSHFCSGTDTDIDGL